jgi:TonB family protein
MQFDNHFFGAIMYLLCCPAISKMRSLTCNATAAISLGLVLALTSSLPARADDRPIVTRVKPVYPEMAKRLRISGSVMLNATVEPDGTVKTVKTVMGEKLLVEAAKDAVMKWKFAPADRESIEDIEVAFQ